MDSNFTDVEISLASVNETFWTDFQTNCKTKFGRLKIGSLQKILSKVDMTQARKPLWYWSKIEWKHAW